MNPNDFEIGFSAEGWGAWGWVHQSNASGSWVASSNGNRNYTFWYGKYLDKRDWGPLSGFYDVAFDFGDGTATINNQQISFTGTQGSDDISSVSLKIFLWYDFRIQAIGEENVTTKLKSCYVKVNGVEVADFIPVRLGQVGYLYDKVSKQLFGNAGTGNFVLGPDI